MGSSIFSSAIHPVSRKCHVADEVGILGTSLFVFGYAFGPLVSSFRTLNFEEMLMIYFTFIDLGVMLGTLRMKTPYTSSRIRIRHL